MILLSITVGFYLRSCMHWIYTTSSFFGSPNHRTCRQTWWPYSLHIIRFALQAGVRVMVKRVQPWPGNMIGWSSMMNRDGMRTQDIEVRSRDCSTFWVATGRYNINLQHCHHMYVQIYLQHRRYNSMNWDNVRVPHFVSHDRWLSTKIGAQTMLVSQPQLEDSWWVSVRQKIQNAWLDVQTKPCQLEASMFCTSGSGQSPEQLHFKFRKPSIRRIPLSIQSSQ